MSPGMFPRVAVVPFLGADGAGKTSLHRALAGIVGGREGLASPPLRVVPVAYATGYATATLLDVRVSSGYLQLVDFPSAQAEESLLGAAPAAGALIVVSATDGVQPATVRSLQHARELGVARMAVALTKCDLVSDVELIDLVTMEIREHLNKIGYGSDVPVLAVSAMAPMGGDGGSMVAVESVLHALVRYAS
jgi:translation elongation factor EF-Tu-like GTPase